MDQSFVNRLIEIDYFCIILFGVNWIGGVFAFRDVFLFDRLIRGIGGLVLCCLGVALLIGGRQRFAVLAFLGHYLSVLISAQIDTDLALVRLSFTGEQLTVSTYHSPYKGIAQSDLKPSCPRFLEHTYSAENVFVLNFNEFCQFVVEVGTEDYANHVLFATIAILPLAILALLACYMATKCAGPDKTIQKLDNEFCSQMRNNQMITSFMSSELNSYI